MSERTFRAGEREHYEAHLAHFSREARIVDDGKTYALTEADLEELAYEARFFAPVGGLNSSVISAAIWRVRNRCQPPLVRAQIIELTAATLRMTADQVEQSLEWTANYMAFHDGMSPEECHPYPRSEP